MSRCRPVRWTALAMFALSGNLGAANSGLTPNDAVRLTLENNLLLRAARQLVGEAEGRSRQTGRLSNPELGSEVAGGRDFEGRVEVGLTQRFPLTARLRLEREISALAIDSARLEVAQREREFAAAARKAWIALAAAQAALAGARDRLRIEEEFSTSLAQAAAGGSMPAFDAAEAAAVVEEARWEMENLRVEEATATVRLATLAGLPVTGALRLRGNLDVPAGLPADGAGLRPDVQLAELNARAGGLDVALARASRWEDVGLGVFVEGERFRDEPVGIESEGLLGLRVTVPLPLWQNGRGRIAETEAGRERRELEWSALRHSAQNEAALARRILTIRHESARRAAAQGLAAARRQNADAEALYHRGEADIQTVFRARQRQRAAEAAVLAANKAYHEALVDWLVAAGLPLTQP